MAEAKTNDKPSLWFVAAFLGAASEIWLHRQIENITRFSVETVTWGWYENVSWDVDGPVHVMDGMPPARRWPSGRSEPFFHRWLRRLINAPSGNFQAPERRSRRSLEALARRLRPDVILAQYGATGLAVLPIAKSFGIPIAVHFHGWDIYYPFRNRWYQRALLNKLHDFDALIVVGSRHRDWVISQGVPAERVHLIPCGVPVAQFLRETSPPEGPAHFISVSRLVPEKGLDVSLEAFALLAAEDPEVKLVIVGDGPERAKLEARASKPDLAGRVRFTGFLRPEAVREQLEAATVFLQHSLRDEGFGVSVTEAAAMEIPLVVSRCGGLADQVVDGRTGFLVEQRDVEGMAAAMRRLAADPSLRREMGRAGREHVSAEYDTAGQVQKLEEVLLSIAGRVTGSDGEAVTR